MIDKIEQYLGEITVLISAMLVYAIRRFSEGFSISKKQEPQPDKTLNIQDLFESVYERERIMIEEINRLKKFATEAAVSMSIMERMLRSAGVRVDGIPIPEYDSGEKMQININNHGGNVTTGDISGRDRNTADRDSDIDARETRRGL